MDCFTGQCPPMHEEEKGIIRLSEGSGGREMHQLVAQLRKMLSMSGSWRNQMDDSAVLQLPHGNLVFTTDSYVITPLFFPGGNIGTLAFCGTVNDLTVMGADPLGISLSLILEEGLPKKDLFLVMETINELSHKYKIPIVTGDTKVMERGKIDKLVITTSGVGIAKKVFDVPLCTGDKIIVSGTVGDHGAALLARRFELDASLATDSKPLLGEVRSIQDKIKQAKDITRGGLAGVLHELAARNKVGFLVDEKAVPVHHEAASVCHLLGIDVFSLACEGRLVCIVSPEHASNAVSQLKKENASAAIIGEVYEGSGVVVNSLFGRKQLPMPSGVIVPRIC